MAYRKQDCFFKVSHAFRQCICNVVLQQRALIKQQAVLHTAGLQPGTLTEVAERLHRVGMCEALKALGSTRMFCHPVYGIVAIKLFSDYV